VESIILDYQKKDDRIIYKKNKKNLWLTQSLNKAIKLTKWVYIARIDDDDIWIEDKLEKQINFLDKNNDYWLIWTNAITIDKNQKINWKIIVKSNNKDIKNNLLISNQFIHSSILIRKNIFEKIWWLYNEKYNWAEDYELWLRVWIICKLHNLNEYLVKYRILDSSISNKNHLNQKILWLKISFKYCKYYNNCFISLIVNFIKLLIPQKLYKKIIYLSNKHK
jgi:hypothetical protein